MEDVSGADADLVFPFRDISLVPYHPSFDDASQHPSLSSPTWDVGLISFGPLPFSFNSWDEANSGGSSPRRGQIGSQKAKCRNGGSPAKLPAPIVASSSSGVSQLKGPSQHGRIIEHPTPLQPLADCIAAFPKWTVTQSVGTADAANLRLITYTKLTSIKQMANRNSASFSSRYLLSQFRKVHEHNII